jgi:hypothetical protein
MWKEKDLSDEQIREQRLRNLAGAASTLTPDQIAACAYAMGGAAGWTKEAIISRLNKDANFWEAQVSKLSPVGLWR